MKAVSQDHNIITDINDHDENDNIEDEEESFNNVAHNKMTNAIEDQDKAALDDGKNAGRWTDEEHAKFLEALQIYGKNWNKVHKHVGSRSSAQTRSHAQKYFNKLMKKNTKESQEELKIFNRKEDS